MSVTNRVLSVNQHIRDDVMALKERYGFTSVNETLEYLLLKEPTYIPVHKRSVEEIRKLKENEPSNKVLRSALLVAQAGVE